MKKFPVWCWILLGFLGFAGPAISQPIFIDQPIQAGDLIVFPHITDTTKYYYLPNKLGLGTDAKGKIQFSFLRYVQNIKTENGEANRTEGEGGGILHTLVELKVTDQQIAQAQAELKKRSNARTLLSSAR